MQFLTLANVCKFQEGFSFEKNKHKNSGEPILKVLNVQKNKITEEGMIYFDKKDYPKDLSKYIVNPGDIVLTKQGASSGKLACNNLNYSLYLSSTVIKFVFDSKIINSRYLFHFLLSKDYEIHKCVYGADPKRLNLEELAKIPINLPPIEEQINSAKILDNFWKLSEELNEELNEELDLRKKQYEYYRDELLSFKQDNKIKWLTLKEIIIDSYRGSPITKSQLSNKGIPCIKYGEIYTTHKIWFDKCISYLSENSLKKYRYCEEGDLLFAIDSNIKENVGACVAYLGKEKLIIDSHTVVVKHNQNAKYLAYALSTKYAQKQKIKLSNINQIVGINKESLKKIKIPLPSLEKQGEIANLLDKFFKLSNNIKEGLPAEILFRKQQYKCYSNKLIN